MAASISHFSRAKNYRFLPTDQKITHDTMTFEFDESEMWNSTDRSQSPDYRKPSSRISRKTAAAAARGGAIGSASLPVNVPDWSKILKDEYREHRRRDHSDDDGDDYDREESGGGGGGDRMIPPHEYLARSRIASFSVHEGIGRTLKGRDLSRVRNAIWQKTGFQD